ncbi:hypothetical protein [Thalassotalea agarivorans]|uniref:Uncharacterized protein n=1 Tax=Thalassotalea agarivorans TaxID=349064 RepID=A0A1H9YAE8_THASX|nr:hypothetical protein [Thalassotalea agarivorans]SES65378.1 hypothetical protein SAMN05660429_00128 [Thalassotalea agarivorans]
MKLVKLIEEGRAIRFFQADFNRFAKLLLKELGYTSQYKFSIPAVSHSRDMNGQRDIYNIRLHIEKPIKAHEIAYEEKLKP